MIKYKLTKKKLTEIGFMLKKGLKDELLAQKHKATGKLSNGIKHHIKDLTLSMMSPVTYWKAVSNPKFFKGVSLSAIKKWVRIKGFAAGNVDQAAARIYYRMMVKPFKNPYGKPYVLWTDGNSLRRMNFEKHVALKYKKKIAEKLAPAIGKDVANMIRKQIKKNKPSEI